MKYLILLLSCVFCFLFQYSAQGQPQPEYKGDRNYTIEFGHSILSDKDLNELFENNIPADLPLRKEYNSDKIYFKVIEGYLNSNSAYFSESYARSLGMSVTSVDQVAEETFKFRKQALHSQEDENELIGTLHPKIKEKYNEEALSKMTFEEKMSLNYHYYHSFQLVSNKSCSIAEKNQIDITKYDMFRKKDEQVKIVLDEACGAYLLLKSSDELNH